MKRGNRKISSQANQQPIFESPFLDLKVGTSEDKVKVLKFSTISVAAVPTLLVPPALSRAASDHQS